MYLTRHLWKSHLVKSGSKKSRKRKPQTNDDAAMTRSMTRSLATLPSASASRCSRGCVCRSSRLRCSSSPIRRSSSRRQGRRRGSFPALNARPQAELDNWLSQIKSALEEHDLHHPTAPAAPFAVNQIVHKTNERLMEDMEVIVKHKVPIVITSLGLARTSMRQCTRMAASSSTT